MLFNQFSIYKFEQPVSAVIKHIEELVAEHEFQPCGKLDVRREGFVPPLGTGEFAPVLSGATILRMKIQERVLPANIVKKEVDEKVEAIELRDDRTVYRKEKLQIKDEVLSELIPRAFLADNYVHGYIDHQNETLVIGSATESTADKFMKLLRQALGSLPVVPCETSKSRLAVMTDWLKDEHPETISLGTQCKLIGMHNGATTACKNQDVESPEIQSMIATGMMVDSLEISLPDVARFVMDSKLKFRSLKLATSLIDNAMDEIEDEDAQQQASIVLNVDAVRQVYNTIGALFGGWQEQTSMDLPEGDSDSASEPSCETPDAEDPLYEAAKVFVIETRKASISAVQRELRIGYNRAARLIETLEERGIVSPLGSGGSRQVLQ